MTSQARAGRAPRVLPAVAVAALLVQLVVLYAPDAPGAAPFPGTDKLVHVGVFLLPTVLALAAGWRPVLVVGGLAAHAVVSEVVQGALLAHRSGDPRDALADLVGVGAGLLGWWLVTRRRAAAASGAPVRRW